ncbi:hypothetical protein GIB67_017373 [Kingdonia uniflora]|uniref:Uncharacterized protein n=1 Tax=Kingdonia uniflora TaxID=39325 RepID=A0A7J7N490_9MAGN|nr:hypothetical protein GIB67_017373 [Kingdonia uniflora]
MQFYFPGGLLTEVPYLDSYYFSTKMFWEVTLTFSNAIPYFCRGRGSARPSSSLRLLQLYWNFWEVSLTISILFRYRKFLML